MTEKVRGAVGPGSLGECDRLVEVLAREFQAPVALLNPVARRWSARSGLSGVELPSAEGSLDWAASAGVLGANRVAIRPPGPDFGPAWLVLPVACVSGPGLIAFVGFSAPTATQPCPKLATPAEVPATNWGQPCPEKALRAWGREVAVDLRDRAAHRGRPGAAEREGWGEAPLLARLVRRLRVSDPPGRFQALAVGAARASLDAEAVAWVPASPKNPVVAAPGGALDDRAWRALAAEARGGPLSVGRRPGGDDPAGAGWFAVVAAEAGDVDGWLVAINPPDGPPFGSVDVELLQPVASMILTQRSNGRIYAELKDLFLGVIRALTAAIDAKDPYTSGHSERVARIAVRLGEALGVSSDRRGDLYLMGLLHDIGKIGIDDGVLKKAGPLTPEEYQTIRSHVSIGVHILHDLKKLHHLLPGVAHHHECMDGSGYPDGLAGESIPLEARILAVADAYDAMSSTRPYRRRMSPNQIDDIFRKGAGAQWDAQIVAALFDCRGDIEAIRQKGLGESLQRVIGETLGRN